MALIVMAIHDTEENNRTRFTMQTLHSMRQTDAFVGNRTVLVDNGSCDKTKYFLAGVDACWDDIQVITNETNVGTARAINQGIQLRRPGEHVIKMDNDVVIHSLTWVEDMEDAIARDPKIGILGLKRKDLMETPYYPDLNWRTTMKMLPHAPGQSWIIVEVAKHIMGTCTMYNSALLDKIGYLSQPSVYGYDDSIACARAKAAGFYNCFLPHIVIDHIDPGGDAYSQWKRDEAAKYASEATTIMNNIIEGKESYYVGYN